MFCPTCGSEERQSGQFCRSCGTDMRSVRLSLERPDEITASAISAREQISRVIAEQIREIDDADDLRHVTEDVLPQIEKFLESPEEKRLRGTRVGVVTMTAGIGAAIFSMLLLSVVDNRELVMLLFGALGLSIVTFLIGLGFALNGLFFTVPRKQIRSAVTELNSDVSLENRQAETGELKSGAVSIPSVTE